MPGPFLVTGASGFAGRHLLEAREPGTRVIALLRDPSAWTQEDWTAELEDVDLVQGSLGDTSEWSGQLPRLAGIFHFAALVRHSRRNAEEVYKTNVDGTLNVVRLAAEHGCRVVMLSTSGTVGCFDTLEEQADETADYCEQTVADWPYYHSKIIAERRARELADSLGVELVFIRPPMLLGPGDHRYRSTANILRMLRGKLPALLRGGIHFIDIRDGIRAIWRAMEMPEPKPIYHLAGMSSTIEDFFALVEQVSGVRAPRLYLPYWLARIVAAIDYRLGILLKGEPLHYFVDPVVVEMASHYWGLTSLYAASDLDYESRDPIVTISDTVAWLQANHESLGQ